MKARIASLFIALLAGGSLLAQAAPLNQILKKLPAGKTAVVQGAGAVSAGAVAGAAVVAGGIAAAAANDEGGTTTGTTGTTP